LDYLTCVFAFVDGEAAGGVEDDFDAAETG